MIECANIFYFNNINAIGGVESWLYYIARLLKDYDITVVYKSGDAKQLNRLRKNVRCIKWDGKEHFKCDILFVNYNPEIIEHTDAKEIYYMIHSDYKGLSNTGQLPKKYIETIAKNKKITKFFAVSELVAQSFYDMTGVSAGVCYNPIVLDTPKKLIRLCSAQRMTKEKGAKRINELVNALEKYCYQYDVQYQWDIYTTDSKSVISTNVVYRKPDINVNRLFGYYDYFVALSDNEGFCYSVVEALSRGIPCVVTPCPVFEELGLNDTNSIKLNFDCSNVDEVAEKIMTSKFKKFKYTAPKSIIEDLIVKIPSNYEVVIPEDETYKDYVLVKCIKTYYDLQDASTHTAGSSFMIPMARAQYLETRGLIIIVND